MLEYLKSKITENLVIVFIATVVSYITLEYMQIEYNIFYGILGGLIGSFGIDAIDYLMGWTNNDESGE